MTTRDRERRTTTKNDDDWDGLPANAEEHRAWPDTGTGNLLPACHFKLNGNPSIMLSPVGRSSIGGAR